MGEVKTWWAYFADWRDLSSGLIQKEQRQAMLNSNAEYQVVDKQAYDALKAERDQLKAKYDQAMKDWSADAILKTERIVSLESDLTCHKEMLKQKDIEIDILKNPGYCTVCGSCGEEGCCSLQKCKFAPTENEIINSLNEENAGLRQDYKDLKSKLEKAMALLRKCHRVEKDRVYEEAGCPGFDGPMTIETWMDKELKEIAGNPLESWLKLDGKEARNEDEV